jgi:hypothetical protein
VSRALPELLHGLPGGAKRVGKIGFGAVVNAAAVARRVDLDLGNAVLVLGTGRSGTTLLLEILGQTPGAMPVYEPLRPSQDPRAAHLLPPDGFVTRDPAAADPALARLWQTVLEGRHLTWWSASQMSRRQWWRADHVVAKEIRANRLAGWLQRTFPETRQVVIVRHPCAVVASMQAAPGVWNDWTHDDVVAPLRDHWPTDVLARAGPDAGRDAWLAAFWAADTAAALGQTTPDHTLVVTFEDLVLRPAEVIEAVFAHLRRPIPPGAIDQARRPSATANPDAAVRGARDPLAEWTRRLDPDRARTVLDVVTAFGITAYGDGLEPDTAALAARRAPPPLDPTA